MSTTVRLAGGTMMPVLGLGTWRMDDDEAATSVASAIEIGYRLIDTAWLYGNERGVGLGLRTSGIARDQVFVTTKLNGEWHGQRESRQALCASLDRLRLDYVDLYLIHWPLPHQDRYVEAWKGLVSLREAGLARAIGVSNFKRAHIDRLIAETGVTPEVNQIELNPTVARQGPRAYHAEHGIVTQSWRPLANGGALFEHPTITRIAAAHGTTPAQVVLRWHLDLGMTAVPKSSSPARMAANLDVFGFCLSADDLTAIAVLDRGEGTAIDADAAGVGN